MCHDFKCSLLVWNTFCPPSGFENVKRLKYYISYLGNQLQVFQNVKSRSKHSPQDIIWKSTAHHTLKWNITNQQVQSWAAICIHPLEINPHIHCDSLNNACGNLELFVPFLAFFMFLLIQCSKLSLTLFQSMDCDLWSLWNWIHKSTHQNAPGMYHCQHFLFCLWTPFLCAS